MKKLIIIVISLTLAFALSACSGGQSETPDKTGNSVPVQSETSSDPEGEKAAVQSYMGQVSDKVGNDITVSLGEIILDGDDGSGETYYVDENGETHPSDGSDFDAGSAVTIFVPTPDDAAGEDTESSGSSAPAEQLPIEFTGEVREFTIPAGAKITNAMGKEVSFDNVTKGSLVQLIVNETTGVVEHLMVM